MVLRLTDLRFPEIPRSVPKALVSGRAAALIVVLLYPKGDNDDHPTRLPEPDTGRCLDPAADPCCRPCQRSARCSFALREQAGACGFHGLVLRLWGRGFHFLPPGGCR
ncbi:protein of unknown function [Denitratisoma oestradiolicum]|uniref:Uncharacterized protein n=1 Tax=Denitratisoma oestradiolicum TaxID=311182 RepID=A0A6S6XRY8_9PROT|nr:protein of unknown function [Denitratisoma oestradiolicum]